MLLRHLHVFVNVAWVMAEQLECVVRLYSRIMIRCVWYILVGTYMYRLLDDGSCQK